MAIENKLLGEFDFVGMPPAPRGAKPPKTKLVFSTIKRRERRRSVGCFLCMFALLPRGRLRMPR
jgi:hypothetical protein